jgi:hypothetical protein
MVTDLYLAYDTIWLHITEYLKGFFDFLSWIFGAVIAVTILIAGSTPYIAAGLILGAALKVLLN